MTHGIYKVCPVENQNHCTRCHDSWSNWTKKGPRPLSDLSYPKFHIQILKWKEESKVRNSWKNIQKRVQQLNAWIRCNTLIRISGNVAITSLLLVQLLFFPNSPSERIFYDIWHLIKPPNIRHVASICCFEASGCGLGSQLRINPMYRKQFLYIIQQFYIFFNVKFNI